MNWNQIELRASLIKVLKTKRVVDDFLSKERDSFRVSGIRYGDPDYDLREVVCYHDFLASYLAGHTSEFRERVLKGVPESAKRYAKGVMEGVDWKLKEK